MQGLDVERIILTLNNLKDETSKQIALLSKVSDYRLQTISHTHNVQVESSDGAHSHGSGAHHHNFMLQGNDPTGGNGLVNHVSDQLTYVKEYSGDRHPNHKHVNSSVIYEREHVELSSEYTGTIVCFAEVLNKDASNMKQIEDDMYTKKETFNNAYGSPWKEIYILMEKIDDLKTYSADHSILQWLGEKFALLNLMQIVLSYSIDAKWAIINYQDYTQRAYDHKFNDKEASITWDHFEKGATIGNRDQNNSESVNVVRANDDPF